MKHIKYWASLLTGVVILASLYGCTLPFTNDNSSDSSTEISYTAFDNKATDTEDIINFIIEAMSDEYVNVWKDYFDMDRDYSAVKKKLLENDNKLKDAIESMWGVRILNQDFFETLISFIISQNKQIPHIKKIVADISAKFGTYKGTYGGADMYTFPSLEQLTNASEEDFKELKTGFRAPYIMDAIRRNMAGH